MTHIVKSAVELIRSRPEMYFPNGMPTLEELISMVMRDVCGASRIKARVAREGHFAMVCADSDWMATERAPFNDLFDRFVLPTPTVVNGHRSEVILAAVSDGLLTQGTAGAFSFNLSPAELPTTMRQQDAWARVLAWRFSIDSWMAKRRKAEAP